MINLVALTLATCVIVVSPGTNGNEHEKYIHERAHCNGWVHPTRTKAQLTSPGYKSFPVPERYNHKYAGKMRVFRMSTSKARRTCGGAMACQWFLNEKEGRIK